MCDIYGPADFTTVVQQAAEDRNVKNIFQFNSPKDPYSSLIGVPLETTEKSRAVSPVTYISEDDPPVLILHGTHDALVPYAQSVQFAGALKAKECRCGSRPSPAEATGDRASANRRCTS